ncbi:MAG: GNAT family N-acetyltransferase [Flavobacteriaceae bacterium]|nr:GNAT family N-acetyltransferase [Flavobacteriaceae bacterium]MCI5087936.1 GNAT family N-acetyltransferase [Flavobacteriaceae bacterium]
MIRAAKPEDLPHILKITQACARDLISKNIFQWNENYPNLAAFQKDLDREELFVYEAQEKILGAVVVSDFMDAVYEPINWKAPTGKNIYIHRLCVHPNHQGKGLAQKLMGFAETKAQQEGYTSVRLDTFSLNKRNVAFYTKRGYTQLGDVYFPVKSKAPFHCFELLL